MRHKTLQVFFILGQKQKFDGFMVFYLDSRVSNAGRLLLKCVL